MAATSILIGAFWAFIPAYFKAHWGTNETLFTLMLNYIALYIVTFLRDGPWRDPEAGGFNKIARFDPNAMLDKVFGGPAELLFASILSDRPLSKEEAARLRALVEEYEA